MGGKSYQAALLASAINGPWLYELSQTVIRNKT
jgi:hypothetical protein